MRHLTRASRPSPAAAEYGAWAAFTAERIG